jgi:hypothetical protein
MWDRWETAFRVLSLHYKEIEPGGYPFDDLPFCILMYRAFPNCMDHVPADHMCTQQFRLRIDALSKLWESVISALLTEWPETTIDELSEQLDCYDVTQATAAQLQFHGSLTMVVFQTAWITQHHTAYEGESLTLVNRSMLRNSSSVWRTLTEPGTTDVQWGLCDDFTGRRERPLGYKTCRERKLWIERPLRQRSRTTVEQFLDQSQPNNSDSASNPPHWAAVNFFPGIGSLTIATAEQQILVIGLCEINEKLMAHLLTVSPWASACLDYKTERWRCWNAHAQSTGHVIELLVASPMCNPFSAAGPRLGSRHPDAGQSVFVAEASASICYHRESARASVGRQCSRGLH